MIHSASPRFWACYRRLPDGVRRLADDKFQLLKENPRHPSLHLKKIGGVWSSRIGSHYRALGIDAGDRIIWVWIGTHAQYDDLVG